MTITGFFSYARIDWEADQAVLSALVEKIAAQARAAHGSRRFSLWRDETGLRWGVEWRGKLHQVIGRTDLFFVLLSPAWVKSEVCREELTAFLAREQAQGWTDRIFVAQIRDIPADDPEIDDAMRKLLALLETRQAKRWRPLLDANQATRDTALRHAGEEIAAVLRSITASRALPPPPPPPRRPSPPPVTGQPLVSGDFYAPSQAQVDGHQAVMLNLVFAGQCKVTLGNKGCFVYGVHAATLHVRSRGGGHMVKHPDFDTTRCTVPVECTNAGKARRIYQIVARDEPLRGTVLAAPGDSGHVPLLLIDRQGTTDPITVSGTVEVDVDCVGIDWGRSKPKGKPSADADKVARMQQAVAQLILDEHGARFDLEEVTL